MQDLSAAIFFGGCQSISYIIFSNFSTYLKQFNHISYVFFNAFVKEFFLHLCIQKHHRSKTKQLAQEQSILKTIGNLPEDLTILSTLKTNYLSQLEYIAKTRD